jgi:hypothetical protein
MNKKILRALLQVGLAVIAGLISPACASSPSLTALTADYWADFKFLAAAKNLYDETAVFGLTPSFSGITGEEFLAMRIEDNAVLVLSGKMYTYMPLNTYGDYSFGEYAIEMVHQSFAAPGGGGHENLFRISQGGTVIGEYLYEIRPKQWMGNSVTVKRSKVGPLVFLSMFSKKHPKDPTSWELNKLLVVLIEK